MSLGRVAWRAQFAALILPGLAASIIDLSQNRMLPDDASLDSSLGALIAQVFAFILLASLTVNAILRVRRSPSPERPELPRFDAIVQLVLVALIVLWATAASGAAATDAAAFGVLTPVLAIGVTVLSVMSYPFAERRQWRAGPFERVPMRRRWPIGALIAAAIALPLAAMPLWIAQFGYVLQSHLSTVATWALLTAGLPWSVPVMIVGLVPMAWNVHLVSVLPAIAVVINAILAVVLIASGRARAAFTLRSLTRRRRIDVDALAEDLAEEAPIQNDEGPPADPGTGVR